MCILKMVTVHCQVVLVLGILLSMIQIDLASGKLGYHIISDSVIPSPDAPCNETELQCLTLSQLANSSSDYLGADMTLHFLPGEHSLDSTLLIKNSDSLHASSLDSNVTIACSHSSASFEFSNISVVHISGLTFTGCTGNKFINITQLTLEDSRFIGNKDSNVEGPALELIESSAKLIRTELSHYYGSRVTSLLCENGENGNARNDFLYGQNINDNIKVSATAGGAIVSTHSNVTIDSSVFEGNSAQAGGAIFAEQQSNITIINSTFVGNQATALQSHQYCYFGGGVLYSDDGSSVTIQDSMFKHNTAHWLAGVMETSLHGSIIIVTNSDFISNSANYFGGVLYNGDYSSTIITDSTFTNNSAYDGGVLHLSHAAFAVVSITHSEFTNNSANLIGGVLYLIEVDNSSITITNSEFTDNGANQNGGVLHLRGVHNSSITITNSEFTNNSANQNGGVLDLFRVHNSSITITNSEFTDNSANQNGGVLHLLGVHNSSITITNSEFTNNSANRNGGVLDLFRVHNSSTTITNSEFTNNSANHGGVLLIIGYAYRIDDTSISIVAGTFVDNKADGAGGALTIREVTDVSVIQSNFSYNKASKGGAMNIIHAYSSVIIHYSQFHHNVANFGGVLYAGNSPIMITGVNFSHNRADNNGGTMLITERAKTSITNCKFDHNTAGNDGGVVRSYQSTIDISESEYSSNSANNEGGVFHTDGTNLIIHQTSFIYSKAKDGGVIWTDQGDLVISQCDFAENNASAGGVIWAEQATINANGVNITFNHAYVDGGVLYAQNSPATITGVNFSHNRADNNGGTMYTEGEKTSITNCKFDHNTAGNDGGVIRSYQSTIDISESEYSGNSANNEGGVFHIDQTNLNIHQTSFVYSKAKDGGVIWTDQGDLMINHSSFGDNNASAGGVIWAEQAKLITTTVNITDNYANVGVVYLLESTSDWSDICYSNNVGSLYALGGEINIKSGSNFTNNTQPSHKIVRMKEGGAITTIQSKIVFIGNCLLTKGHAEHGGALKALHSKVYFSGSGNMTIANNTATDAGGGIYLYHSELICRENSILIIGKNFAKGNGGGISAIGSVIKIKNINSELEFSSLYFDSNEAINGGGLFLEMDSQIHILKSRVYKSMTDYHRYISFSLNSAQYGGAIYVSDSDMCRLSSKSVDNECFIQALAMYSPMPDDFDPDDYRCQNIDFSNNTAETSGNSLFGGLLDRCTVSQFAETNINNVNMDYTFSNGTMVVQGLEYFQKISNIQDRDIDSPPIQVCFCTNGQPNCSHQHDPIPARKGQQQNISLNLAIVNQIHDPLEEATILSHFHSGNYLCQNHIHSMDGSCRKVNFAVSSNNDTEELILSLSEGPCKDAPDSKARVMIEFSCPQCLIGFELDESEEGCRCVCDSQLSPYFTNCSGETLIRERNVWVTSLNISYTSDIHQYLIHPYCPFDYCHPPSSRVEMNLNLPNGADAQCTNHRAGLLCGKCQHNFSLSLGSSHCLPCSTHWYAVLIAILIAAVLAGVMLVALLLALKLTVATGTLNGVIFYANIVYASNSVFLPFTEPFNLITAFISWLNLEIGVDACFFVGMDAYSKTLLQLAFSGYVFFLVFMVIIISKHSMRFSQLIGKHNPVATLATLISLSYAKFLHITIASLSFAILKYPDGSQAYVWLVDASVGYLSGKHAILFITALLIIIAGVCYTALLLFWQWFLRHQDKTLLKWMKYQKLCHFLEPYHAPFVDKHRYWAGLLFLVRVVLYIVFALNVNGDPHVSLVAIILIIGALLLAKGFLVKVYKKWPIDVMESIMYFNILGFAALTWYFIGTPHKQRAVAYTSVTITLLFLLLVIAFHVYKFTFLGFVIQKTKIFKVLAAKLLDNKKAKETVDQNPTEPEQKKQEVTFSVVEVPKPVLERPEPEAHVQIRPLELPQANSQEWEMQDRDNK